MNSRKSSISVGSGLARVGLLVIFTIAFICMVYFTHGQFYTPKKIMQTTKFCSIFSHIQ
ncbi:unnamed protein product, partial [Cylicocyclus nassatus]